MRILLLSLLLTASCMTPGEKKQIKKDLFDAQARILHLERLLNQSTKGGNETARRAANTAANIDKVSRDVQMLRGEVDGLRIGVMTGQMPGISEAEAQGSVAYTLKDLSERVEELENSQDELLAAIKTAGVKKKSSSKRSSAKTNITSLKSLRDAFKRKRYTQVSLDGGKVAGKLSGVEKEEALYLQAESYYKLGKMRDAALKFNDFIESKPSTKYHPSAKMRMGDCFRNLGDKETAKLYYNELLTEFPDSDEASEAKKRIAKL